jgi:putative ABC transport system permease protein
MERRIAQSLARPRFYMFIAALFGGMALAMALIGLYGVVAYSVSRRTHEIGVRMALGATRIQVRAMVLGQAGGPVLGGLAVGVAGAVAVARLLGTFMYGMNPVDLWLTAAMAGALALAAGAASYIPARRASAVDPVQALAYE